MELSLPPELQASPGRAEDPPSGRKDEFPLDPDASMEPGTQSGELARAGLLRLPGLRYLCPLAGIILLGVGLWWWLGPSAAPPPVRPPAEEKSHMEGLSLTEIDKEGKRWGLKASRAEYLRNRQEILVQDISLEFYTKEQEVVRLQAPTGVVDTKGKELVLRGGVELVWNDLVLRTPEVHYLPRHHSLLLPEEVLLEGPAMQVRGKGLSVDLRQRRLSLKNHYLTTLKLGKGLW